MKICASILTLLIAFTTLSPADEPKPDDQARFLAGISIEGTAPSAMAQDSSWQRHAKEFDSGWKDLEKRQLEKIREWLPQALGNDTTSRDHLFYFFSGPDFLYANTFFPNAATYVFCGLEPVGTAPDVSKLPPGALAASLSNLRKSLNAVISFSFFLTKEMKNDLRATQLTGTLPVLYVFMARLDCRIQSVELMDLDNEGNTIPKTQDAQGVKITFTKQNGKPQTLYYFSTDLSNSGIKNKPGFIKFCDKLGTGNSFVKAASYLMHNGEFTGARDFLLSHSKTLVQDDSGIPYGDFPQEKWYVACLGRYPGPIEMFKSRYQRDLASVFNSVKPPPLTFSFGYRWHPNESSIMIATALSHVPKAVPVSP
ncbi:MAG: hypothetical protein WCN98_13600 [Verrucomicrobiaceae bacterium]